MTSILIVTVGGSPQPIITSVETLRPERVIFICSGGKMSSSTQVIGPGKPCKIIKGGVVERELPNLPTCLNLQDRFSAGRDLIIIEALDDPAECYRICAETIAGLVETVDRSRIRADYTGGTKSMSIGLAMAAVDYGIALHVTTATNRKDLGPVQFGEVTEIVATSIIETERNIRQFLPVFLHGFHYPAAIAQLQNMLTRSPVPGASRSKIRDHLDYCKALDAWDKFDHIKAWRLLERFMGNSAVQPLGLFLKQVMGSRKDIDIDFKPESAVQGHGYEIIEDLLHNARRRAAQERFDDAVGRMYRALELLAQVRLKTRYGILTGDVAIDKVPPEHRDAYERKRDSATGKIILGLRESYTLLSRFSGDALGDLFGIAEKRILDGLKTRNQSIMAHGFTPVTAQDYAEIESRFGAIITQGIAALAPAGKAPKPIQFPREMVL